MTGIALKADYAHGVNIIAEIKRYNDNISNNNFASFAPPREVLLVKF